jgi:hypothetical protein
MSINRSAPTPAFYEYMCNLALVLDPASTKTSLPQAVADLVEDTFIIPTFQRGISWSVEKVSELLNSDSIMFGTVMLAMFDKRAGELIDGLQRFATGTALLQNLYDRVLSPTPSNSLAAVHFGALKAKVAGNQPVFSHNHHLLDTHTRAAIRQQYQALFKSLGEFLDRKLEPGTAIESAEQLKNCFLQKQIAIDKYYGFQSALEMVNTFIGLNTVRVELGPVDLIRAHVIDQASRSRPAWASTDIVEAENDITETFTVSGSTKQSLLPAATIVLRCLQKKDGLEPSHIFPKWSDLGKGDVDQFLEFIENMEEARKKNAYLREIAESGYGPYAMVLLFYYKRFITSGQEPDFFTGGAAEDPELHTLLCAVYRAVIGGTVGRLIRPYAEDVAKDNYTALSDVSEKISMTAIPQKLSAPPDLDWLRTNLSSIGDSKKARRVFNGCLLPLRTSRGATFKPLKFGSKGDEWQVDHLIPEKNLKENQPGFEEGYTLRNYAPLPKSYNSSVKNLPCSNKLDPSGRVYADVKSSTHSHPYVDWLVVKQAGLDTALDKQENLLKGSVTGIGDQRIDELVELLKDRL